MKTLCVVSHIINNKFIYFYLFRSEIYGRELYIHQVTMKQVQMKGLNIFTQKVSQIQ